MPDHRLDSLAPLERSPLHLGERFDLAAMNDLNSGVVDIDAASAQVDNDLLARPERGHRTDCPGRFSHRRSIHGDSLLTLTRLPRSRA